MKSHSNQEFPVAGSVGAAVPAPTAEAARPPAVNSAAEVNRASGAALGFLVASLIFSALAVVVRYSVKVPAIDADRAAQRSKDLAELRATGEISLTTAGWIDQNRGLVRLPISIALQITESEWQNPAAARSNLIARVEKATAPAPAAPPKTNPFE